MKSILSSLFILALSTCGLFAQTLTTVNLSTNKVIARATNSTAGVGLPVLGANKVSLFYRATGVSSNATYTPGGGAVTFQFDVSADDVTYYTDTRYRFPLLLSGTTTVSGWTNIGTQGYQYIRLSVIENASTNATASNIVVQALSK